MILCRWNCPVFVCVRKDQIKNNAVRHSIMKKIRPWSKIIVCSSYATQEATHQLFQGHTENCSAVPFCIGSVGRFRKQRLFSLAESLLWCRLQKFSSPSLAPKISSWMRRWKIRNLLRQLSVKDTIPVIAGHSSPPLGFLHRPPSPPLARVHGPRPHNFPRLQPMKNEIYRSKYNHADNKYHFWPPYNHALHPGDTSIRFTSQVSSTNRIICRRRGRMEKTFTREVERSKWRSVA